MMTLIDDVQLVALEKELRDRGKLKKRVSWWLGCKLIDRSGKLWVRSFL